MKVGLIGLGVMGRNHLRVLRSLGHEVIGLEPNKQIAAEQRVTVCDTLEELMASGIHCAHITAPTPLHKDIAISLLNKRIPTFIEKPVASTIEEASAILAVAGQTPVAVGYIERFNPAYKYLMQLIESGYFGEITSINIKRVGGLPRSATNVILDLSTHDLDLLCNIFKRHPENIWAHAHVKDGITDAAQVFLTFGEASATCESNWLSPVKIREVHVTGTHGCVIVDLIRQEVTKLSSLSPNSKVLDVTSFNLEPLKEEITAFLSDVSDGKITRSVTLSDAMRTLEVTLGAVNASKK